ncbi:TIGR01244 family phosphatase [Sphingomonas sabuli]|uniref:TIGR01244 family phosphatase n=1 Tax=Sphingomonas sabuli TaxID=2764186 RepID=A0A7G9L0A8_9SPHN|nr:TIGR01244 family sulfur transferase [Sphingomonas sabuli]QNM82057.1 TIGR01244 family phosphatase [Sphingomonas sabuli]
MIRRLSDTVMVSAQIRPDDVPVLKRSGVTMIVCQRPDDEDPGQPPAAEIEKAAEDAGIEFRFLPIVRGIGPADAEAMREAMEATSGKLFAYCRSGNRCTLAWAVARRKQGASREEVEEIANRAGVDLTPIDHLL